MNPTSIFNIPGQKPISGTAVQNKSTPTEPKQLPVGQYWLGANGNIYWNNPTSGVQDMGKPLGSNPLSNVGFSSEKGSFQSVRIADPNPPQQQQQTSTDNQQTSTDNQQSYVDQMLEQARKDREAQAAADAQKKREEEQKAAGLRGTIGDIISKGQDIYKQLFGKTSGLYGEQKQTLEQQYRKGLGELAQTYSTEMPKIGQAYAAQGAYRSTWRGGAEQTAQQGYQKQLEDLAQKQKEATALIGGGLTKAQSEIQQGQTDFQTTLDRLNSVTDVNELTSLRNAIESKLGNLQTQLATAQTQPEQLAAASAISGLSDKFASANQTISTIIGGQAPPILKKQIATQIVLNSDLTDQEKKQLQDRINTEIA